MTPKYYFVFLLALIYGCHNEKKQNGGRDISVHKVWVFQKIEHVKHSSVQPNPVWVGKNILDLTDKDTLRFSYGANKIKPTSYAYTISHDSILAQNKTGYKILSLTQKELKLMSLAQNKNLYADTVVLVYEAK